MDARDFRILLELHRHPFASHEAIGRSVHLAGTAVKTRFDRMRSRGVIQGFYVVIAALAFRRYRRIHAFATAGGGPSLAEIVAADRVVSVWRGPPGMFMVTTYDSEAEAGPPEPLVQLFGGPPLASVSPDDPEQPSRNDAVLSPLDWRVLAALLDAPRAALQDLAAATGLTAKTVRSHRDHLVARGLLEVTPILDTSREPGLVVYSGYVAVRRVEDLRKVRAPGMGHIWTHHNPPAMAVLGYVASYGQALEVEQQLKSLPGVDRVVVTVARGGCLAMDRLKEWIRLERERWPRPAR